MSEWVTVPVEPTREMLLAANNCARPMYLDVYRAMIAAAPCPESELAKLRLDLLGLCAEWEADWADLAIDPQKAPKQLRRLLGSYRDHETPRTEQSK